MADGAPSVDVAPAGTCPPDFAQLSWYGWEWRRKKSVDENYLDLAYLIARNSTCKDGHMGCVLVREHKNTVDVTANEAVSAVVLCTINTALFGEHRSDCHAEANAVASCAATGQPLRGLSCYVTRSPCTACYKLLAMAGIGRIISPQQLASADCAASARLLGIQCCELSDTPERSEWRMTVGTANEDMDRIRALREERKRLKKEGRFGKKSIRAGRLGPDYAVVESDPTTTELPHNLYGISTEP